MKIRTASTLRKGCTCDLAVYLAEARFRRCRARMFDSQTWLNDHFEKLLCQAFVDHYDFPKSTGIFIIANGRIGLEQLRDVLKIGMVAFRVPMHALKFRSHDPVFQTMYVVTAHSSLDEVRDALKRVARSDARFYDDVEKVSKRITA